MATSPLDKADVIVALGGDGLMLQTLHLIMKAPKPIYGMNRGSVGFLMNEYSEHGLRERLAAGAAVDHSSAHHARAATSTGPRPTARAINEVSLLRQTYQAAKLRIEIDGTDAARRTDRRRHPGLDAGRLDRLQSFRQRADPAARRAADGADAALAVPPAPLARRAPAGFASASPSRCWKPTSARSPPPPTISRSAASSRSTWRWTRRRRSSCCTIPAIRSTSGSCANSSATRRQRNGQIRARDPRDGPRQRPVRSDPHRDRGRRGRRRRRARSLTRSIATAKPRRCCSMTRSARVVDAGQAVSRRRLSERRGAGDDRGLRRHAGRRSRRRSASSARRWRRRASPSASPPTPSTPI